MSSFFESLQVVKEPYPVEIPCLQGVIFKIQHLTKAERDNLTDKALKGSRLKAGKHSTGLIKRAVKGWEGMTEGAVASILSGKVPPAGFDPNDKIEFSLKNLEHLVMNSQEFVNDMINIISSDETLNEIRKEVEAAEAELKNSPSSVGKASPLKA